MQSISHKFKKGQFGFTLIELLVVIAIIGILAGVILVSLTSARRKARDAQIKSAFSEVSLALELYSDDNNSLYPAAPVGAQGVTATNYSGLAAVLVPSYLKALPTSPNSNAYEYASCNSAADYELNAVLENTSDTADETDNTAATGEDGYYEVGSSVECIAAGQH